MQSLFYNQLLVFIVTFCFFFFIGINLQVSYGLFNPSSNKLKFDKNSKHEGGE